MSAEMFETPGDAAYPIAVPDESGRWMSDDDLAAVRAQAKAEGRREIGLWATCRKAFMESSRERDRAFDRNTTPTLSSEFWRGHESALDDLIRTVTADEPTDPMFRATTGSDA